jgi:SAM-dependent methyltransferase
MHVQSYSKMESFFRVYRSEIPAGADGKVRVLDVGSKSYDGHTTYKTIVDAAGYEYVGLDLEHGLNVDVVPKTPYVWPEIEDASIQVAISGQTFEHNPFFWATLSEMTRALVPGGYLVIIAPGSGPVHRYPIDCYRFYPDSWSALCALVGLDLVETYWEPDSVESEMEDWAQWRDTMLIARKPAGEAEAETGAAERRAQLTAPFRDGFGTFEPVSYRAGPAVADYLETVPRVRDTRPRPGLRRRIALMIFPKPVFPLFEPNAD